MSKGLDWEKASRRDKARAAQEQTVVYNRNMAGARRSQALERKRAKHNLACFKCGSTTADRWAKMGRSTRGLWIICAACVEAKET